jgi:hypothetical protein
MNACVAASNFARVYNGLRRFVERFHDKPVDRGRTGPWEEGRNRGAAAKAQR